MIPWGMWHRTSIGTHWTPNAALKMTEEQQHASNLKHGHSCVHFNDPGDCKQCGTFQRVFIRYVNP